MNGYGYTIIYIYCIYICVYIYIHIKIYLLTAKAAKDKSIIAKSRILFGLFFLFSCSEKSSPTCFFGESIGPNFGAGRSCQSEPYKLAGQHHCKGKEWGSHGSQRQELSGRCDEYCRRQQIAEIAVYCGISPITKPIPHTKSGWYKPSPLPWKFVIGATKNN